MSPTLSDADIVLVRRAATATPGDVVLVVWPGRRRVQEPQETTRRVQEPQETTLSVKRAVHEVDGGWFVRGDNAFGSTDSRELGPATVVGVVTWRLWPRPGRIARSASDQGGGA